MYTGHVVLEQASADADTVHRVELYLLGDYLDDMVFCENIVQGLVELSRGPEHKLPSGTAVRLAWSKTSVDSPLRAVVKELFLGVAINSAVEVLLKHDGFPHEFILDLMSSLVDNNSDFCKRSISRKSDIQIREACKGFVRSANEERLSSTTGIRNATANHV